jgi:3-deoxy-D-manno-octulosonate 8-phosphate phosphatase (KDO 8-P phosphatase)
MSAPMQDAVRRAGPVKLAIFDVDGVMTDGRLVFGDDGQEYKAFNSLDGHGLKMLQSTGVDIAIITGRSSNVVAHRARNLGITHLYQGVDNKLEAYQMLLAKLELEPEHTAYMGDDVIDLPIMIRCGLAIAVPAAPAVVRQHAHFTTQQHGGNGAVREACEFIMQAQGSYDGVIAHYLA